ncbi:MAG: hypothetical protein L0027_15245 [Candidatus Rokubacteria bacterium]|nr:hypothetical protein [Candidatus Rokubacteria bacterium]
MSFWKKAVISTIGLASIVVAVPPVTADTAAYYEPPAQPAPEPTRARLVADRQFGFAPMTVTLSGMLESGNGMLHPIDESQDVVLVVESPFLHTTNGSGSRSIGTDFRYEARTSTAADARAFYRAVEIKRPGRYLFRIQVLDGAGQVLQSNEVTIKAM